MNCSEKIKKSPYSLSRYGDFFRLFLFHCCDLRCHICPGLKLRECEFGIEVFQRKASQIAAFRQRQRIGIALRLALDCHAAVLLLPGDLLLLRQFIHH